MEEAMSVALKKAAKAMVDTGDVDYALYVTGGDESVVASKAFVVETTRMQRERLFQSTLPKAVKLLEQVLEDEGVPAGVRVNAAKVVLDRTLGADEEYTQEPHEMSAEEISNRIAALEREKFARAKDVTGGKQ